MQKSQRHFENWLEPECFPQSALESAEEQQLSFCWSHHADNIKSRTANYIKSFNRTVRRVFALFRVDFFRVFAELFLIARTIVVLPFL